MFHSVIRRCSPKESRQNERAKPKKIPEGNPPVVVCIAGSGAGAALHPGFCHFAGLLSLTVRDFPFPRFEGKGLFAEQVPSQSQRR